MKYKLNNEWKELSHPLIVGGGSGEEVNYVPTEFETIPAVLKRKVLAETSTYAYTQTLIATVTFKEPTTKIYYFDVGSKFGASLVSATADGRELDISTSTLKRDTQTTAIQIPIGTTTFVFNLEVYAPNLAHTWYFCISEQAVETNAASNNTTWENTILAIESVNIPELLDSLNFSISDKWTLTDINDVNTPEQNNIISQGYLQVGETKIYDSDGGMY